MAGRRSYKPDVEGSIPFPTTFWSAGASLRDHALPWPRIASAREKRGLEDSPPHSKIAGVAQSAEQLSRKQ